MTIPTALGEARAARKWLFILGALFTTLGVAGLAYYADEYFLLRQAFRNEQVEVVEGCASTRPNNRVSEWLVIGDREFLVGSPLTEGFSNTSILRSLSERHVSAHVTKRRMGDDVIVWLAIWSGRCRS